MSKNALLVIAKRPAAGQTKTRLCQAEAGVPALSPEQAAALYECFLRDTLELARTVPDVTRWLNYSPQQEIAYFRTLAPDFKLLLQEGGALGERLDHAVSYCLRNGFDRAVIMDSDSPTLPGAYLTQALEALTDADIVLGPCQDGGYYLIGLKQPQPRLLREVKMSTAFVLQDTLELARQEKLRVALLSEWYDVDTVSELAQLRRALASSEGDAKFTRAFLNITNSDVEWVLPLPSLSYPQ